VQRQGHSREPSARSSSPPERHCRDLSDPASPSRRGGAIVAAKHSWARRNLRPAAPRPARGPSAHAGGPPRVERRPARRRRALAARDPSPCSSTVGSSTLPPRFAGPDEDQTLDLTEALARHSLIYLDVADRGPRSRLLSEARRRGYMQSGGIIIRVRGVRVPPPAWKSLQRGWFWEWTGKAFRCAFTPLADHSVGRA
jgi:hypothetical protein